jgi:DNA-binding NarL/FixJ family response regulator
VVTASTAAGSGVCAHGGIPVLVVDDDDGCRRIITAVLEEAGYSVSAVGSGHQAVQVAGSERPRVVILDVCMPDMSGYEVCRQLKERFGDSLPILFVSGVRTESFDRVAGLIIGADDYIGKPFAADELIARVRRLARQTAPVSTAVGSRLTTREMEVLRLLADGMGQDAIATQLFISPKTVATHIDHILQKLDVHTRAQAVAMAYRAELMVEA